MKIIKQFTIIASFFSIYLIALKYSQSFQYIKFYYSPLFASNSSTQTLQSNQQISNKVHLVNPELNDYLNLVLNPTSLCRTQKKTDPFIFIYVFLAAKNYERRKQIRDTWANKTYFKGIRVAFIIGRSNNESVEKKLITEQKKHADLIQGAFIDAYRNLSYKSLLSWKWIKSYCSNAKFYVKIDDDVVLNTFFLEKILSNPKKNFPDLKDLTFLCKYWTHAPAIRDPNSKWYASPAEYNQKLYGMNHYPTYCAGMGLLMTSELMVRLYTAAFDVKVFWIDDVYVGIVGRQVGARFKSSISLVKSKSSYLNVNVKQVLFITDCNTDQEFHSAWNNVVKRTVWN